MEKESDVPELPDYNQVVRYHFGSWNAAIAAAGLEAVDKALVTKEALFIDDSDLFYERLCIYQEHQDVTESLISQHCRFSVRPYLKRWGSIKAALHEAVALHQQGLLSPETPNSIQAATERTIPNPRGAGLHIPTQPKASRKRSVVGKPIDFRGMRFAPVNEQGVVYLFGMVSQELGFLVESVRVQYPDCEGKRCCDPKNNL